MANIQSNLNKIKNAVLGVDVRDSIHDGIKAINEEVENTTDRQVQLEGTFDELVINAGNSNAEVAAARVDSTGKSHGTLGKRLNNFDSQIKEKANKDEIFSMANMGQDIKEAMTGGSVSVIGSNMVDRINVKNKAIDVEHTNFIVEEIPNLITLNSNDITGYNYSKSQPVTPLNNQNMIVCSGDVDDWLYIYVKLNLISGKTYTYRVKNEIGNEISVGISNSTNPNEVQSFSTIKADNNGYYSYTFEASSTSNYLRIHSKTGNLLVSRIGIFLGETYNKKFFLDDSIKLRHLDEGMVGFNELNTAISNNFILLYDKLYSFDKTISFGNATNVVITNERINGTFDDGQYFCLNGRIFEANKKYVIAYKVKADKDYRFSIRSAYVYSDSWNKTIFNVNSQTANVYSEGKFIYNAEDDGRIAFNADSTGTGVKNYEIQLKIFDVTGTEDKYLYNIDYLSLPEYSTMLKTSSSNESDSGNKLDGKKIVFYGDSITAQNIYPQIVGKYYNCNVINLGVGGAPMSEPASETTAFCNDSRLETIPTDSDYIFVMGGTNDWNRARIGTIDNDNQTFDTSTFKGGLAKVIKSISTRCPNAKLIICTAIGGRGASNGETNDYPLLDKYNQTPYDIRNATIDVASLYNVDVCDTWSCGINGFNRNIYIADSVHPTEEGAKLIADYIINHLKKYN